MVPVGVVLSVVAIAAVAPADTPDAFDGPPPTFVVVEQVDRTAIEYTYVRMNLIQRERTFEVETNGKRSQQKEIVTDFVPEQRAARMDLDLLDVIDADGKKLDRDAALDRLRQAKVVLLAQDNRGVHPMYRKVLAKDALILVPKRPPAKPAAIAR